MGKLLLGIGTTLSAAGQIQQGQATQREAEFNVRVGEQEAQAQRLKARFEQERQVERGARVKSTLISKIGAAGGLDSPVAGDILAEQAAELELENLLIGFEGETKARRAESQAKIDRLRGRNIKRARTIKAGATLLKGFGSTFT